MNTKPYDKLKQPEAYNQRDVFGLKKLSQWSSQHRIAQLTHNRMLQKGFMHRSDVSQFIDDARSVGVEWLTDVACPSTKTALFLHMAKELVVNYKVSETKLNEVTQLLYQKRVQQNENIEFEISNEIEYELKKANIPLNLYDYKQFDKLNSDEKSHLFAAYRSHGIVDWSSEDKFNAAKRLVNDIERKRITDRVVAKKTKDFLKKQDVTLNLARKSVSKIENIEDICITGAAGSGKSTILNKVIPPNKKKQDYIVLALDDFRVLVPDDIALLESKAKTKDEFTRSQDIAYLFRELCYQEIDEQITLNNSRSPIIVDGANIDNKARQLLAQGKVHSFLAAYRGTPGYGGVAERAFDRAKDNNAAPADKGRFVKRSCGLERRAVG